MTEREKNRKKKKRCSHMTPADYVLRSPNEKKYGMRLPPEEGGLGHLEMLIHDCRQYLMIASGEIKDISEEGVLDLDDPTEDIEKITIRLKRLKEQCMRAAGFVPLSWLGEE